MPHPDGSVDPLRDAKMLELELILADLAAVERRLERLEANIKKANKAEDVAERALFVKMKDCLESERPLRELALLDEERRRLRSYSFLSEKPVLLVVNLGEEQIRGAATFLESSGLTAFASPAAPRAVSGRRAHRGGDGRALARGRQGLPRGPRPPGARPRPRDPDLLHPPRPDLVPHRGRGRVPRLDHPTRERGPRSRRGRSTPTSSGASSARRWWPSTTSSPPARIAACREKGTLRLEGKDYEVRDGDVIDFRFNV